MKCLSKLSWFRYGGHYGPAFAHHFLQQNDAIANGSISGITLNFRTLGVGNGLTDPLHQYAEYSNYAGSNPYGATVNETLLAYSNSSFYDQGGCRDQVRFTIAILFGKLTWIL